MTAARRPGTDPSQTPYPYDHYPLASLPPSTGGPLSPFGARLVLSAFPTGSRIIAAEAGRAQYLPCPVRVTVGLADGGSAGGHGGGVDRVDGMDRADGVDCVDVYLRMDRMIGGVEREAVVLPVLARLGLPVPGLLAGPATDPEWPDGGAVAVLSALPGRDLLHFVGASGEAPEAPERAARGIDLLLQGLDRLHALTAAVEATPLAQVLPRRTLLSELAAIEGRGGPWLEHASFAAALTALSPVLAAVRTPLVFSNGDYNPGNFLTHWPGSPRGAEQAPTAAEGEGVTGFVDFAHACFEDPHLGLAKCRTYDWWPWCRAGLVERYRQRCSLTTAAFAPRLALQCLWTLQREVSVVGPQDADYRAWLLALLAEGLGCM